MKALNESRRKQIGRLAPSFSLRRSAPKTFEADECNQTGILTLASDLFPPSRFLRNSGSGNCSHYSGATVPDFHRVPRHLTAISGIAPAVSKNKTVLPGINFFPSYIFNHQILPKVLGSILPLSRALFCMRSAPRFGLEPPLPDFRDGQNNSCGVFFSHSSAKNRSRVSRLPDCRHAPRPTKIDESLAPALKIQFPQTTAHDPNR